VLSDGESKDILEARFEKPVGVLDLIESVKKLDYVDSSKIGIWSHSNGGQIAISVLEITGQTYPTVLWAPMTNPFPDSVLDTMDDSENGKIVKQKIADFEKDYDSKLYSIDNFYNWIEAPILIHQGTADVWCKVNWQKDLQSRLKKIEKEVSLDIRQDNDHNLKQSWDEVIKMDIEFFKEKFKIFF
jgi:dienelactone hydrolase